jgi:hypothetical protein
MHLCNTTADPYTRDNGTVTAHFLSGIGDAYADNVNGLYNATYTPTTAGVRVLNVKFDGVHVVGSPLVVVVAPGRYNHLQARFATFTLFLLSTMSCSCLSCLLWLALVVVVAPGRYNHLQERYVYIILFGVPVVATFKLFLLSTMACPCLTYQSLTFYACRCNYALSSVYYGLPLSFLSITHVLFM